MNTLLKPFRTKGDGAVTIDWIVLTAAVVALVVTGVSVIDDARKGSFAGESVLSGPDTTLQGITIGSGS